MNLWKEAIDTIGASKHDLIQFDFTLERVKQAYKLSGLQPLHIIDMLRQKISFSNIFGLYDIVDKQEIEIKMLKEQNKALLKEITKVSQAIRAETPPQRLERKRKSNSVKK